MDLRQLRYFVEVAEVSGFNEAAARLRVSQSSVSRRVRDLELELKVQLFQRDPGGARLTASGRILLERALSILREIEVAKNDVVTGSTAPVGVVTVGFSSASGQLFIPPLVERAARELPLVQLRFFEGTQYMLLESIGMGKVDLAVMISPSAVSSCKIQPLTVEGLCHIQARRKLQEGADAGPAAGAEMAIAELAGIPLVLFPRPSANRDYLDRAASIGGVSLNVRYEIADLTVQKQLIRTGCVDGMLPLWAVQDGLASGELVATPVRGLFISSTIVTCVNRSLLPSVEAVAARIRDIVAGSQSPPVGNDGHHAELAAGTGGAACAVASPGRPASGPRRRSGEECLAGQAPGLAVEGASKPI